MTLFIPIDISSNENSKADKQPLNHQSDIFKAFTMISLFRHEVALAIVPKKTSNSVGRVLFTIRLKGAKEVKASAISKQVASAVWFGCLFLRPVVVVPLVSPRERGTSEMACCRALSWPPTLPWRDGETKGRCDTGYWRRLAYFTACTTCNASTGLIPADSQNLRNQFILSLSLTFSNRSEPENPTRTKYCYF